MIPAPFVILRYAIPGTFEPPQVEAEAMTLDIIENLNKRLDKEKSNRRRKEDNKEDNKYYIYKLVEEAS